MNADSTQVFDKELLAAYLSVLQFKQQLEDCNMML